MDPLSLLKEFNLSRQVDAIKIEGDDVNFGGRYVFKKSAYTAFKGQRDYYTIEAVLYVLLTRTLSQPEYLKAAAAAKLGTVAFVDRKKLLDFLDGKTDLQLDTSQALLPAAAPTEADAQRATKRARVEEPGGISGIFDRYEIQLRDRNSMLVAPNKEFKRVLDIATKACAQLSSLIKQKEQQAKQAQEAAAKHKHQADKKEQASRPAVVGAKPSGRFDRDTTADALKAMGGAGAAALASTINMYGSATSSAAAAKPSSDAPPPPPPPPPPSSQPQSQPHKSSHRPSSTSSQRPPSSSQPRPGSGAGVAGKDKDKAKPKGVPIIIVPTGMTAMVNMYNAKVFLEEGRYEPSAAVQARGVQKVSSDTFMRTFGKPPGTKPVPYQVTDKAPPAGSPDWQRVVAVIVQGAKWQFKDWPHKGAASGDLVDAFNKVLGVYVHYSDEKVPPLVADWNVRRLGLAREKRHMDSTALLDFYRMLDQFLTSSRSSLAY